MKTLIPKQYIVLLASIGLLVTIITACNTGEKNSVPKSQPIQHVLCPKGLLYAECPNPKAMHGQIMIHNMTERSYKVTVEHHPNEYETKQIAPRDGWTFVGVIQGKTLITAQPSTGGETIESTCTVVGNTQHMMNITDHGFEMGNRLMEHYSN